MPPLQNVLAQMLAGQGPAYQPGDTRWGLPGDRLLRFTPQQGNAGMAGGGTFGKGGTPPPAGGGGGSSGIQTGPNGSSVMPGLNPLGIGDGSGTQINWANLITAMQPGGNPPGAPAINAAMEKLKGTGLNAQGKYSGPVPTPGDVASLQAAWKALAGNPPPHSASRAEKDAWFAQKTAAENAYTEAQKRTGYGPGGYTLG
jgi:hypothetical protein